MARVFLNKVYNRTEFYGCVHPLGIMYLAAKLREDQPGQHEIRLHDMILRREMADLTLPKILDFEPDIVGLSTMTHEASVAHELGRAIKRERPHTKVIIGGPYTGGRTDEILARGGVDYVVSGEGEFTFSDMVAQLADGNEHMDTRGVSYLKEGRYVNNGPCIQSHGEVLDSLPFPAWDLIDNEAYYDVPRYSSGYARREYMSVFTSRGCPYRCTYCHEQFTKTFHGHSPERVLAEIDAIVARYGVGELSIVDDIFNIDRERAQRICEMITERGYDLKLDFPNGVRADAMTYELLQAMKAAGTYRLSYAIETATPRLQRMTEKHVNLNRMRKAIAWSDELDIFVNGFFMLGFPTETRDEVDATIEYALSSRLHTANFFAVNPFEGTGLGDQVEAMGIEANSGLTDNFDYYKAGAQLGEMKPEEIQGRLRDANRRFYLDPKRLWRLLRVLPNKSHLPWLVVVFIIRALTSANSQRESQRWLDHAFRIQAWWGRTISRLWTSKQIRARQVLARDHLSANGKGAPARPRQATPALYTVAPMNSVSSSARAASPRTPITARAGRGSGVPPRA